MQKVCVVTGGSSGIGLSVIRSFQENGYRVFNLDIQSCNIGEHIFCDVSSMAQVQQSINSILDQTKHIDCAVANAGIHFSATIADTTEDDFDKVMAINVKGAYALIKAILPSMRAKKQGVITLVASDQAVIAKPRSFAYNMSKHALASLAKTTALDYADEGIRVNAICPGTIDTPLYQKAIEHYCKKNESSIDNVHAEEAKRQPIGRIGKPEEVAAFIQFLSSDDAAFITGSLQMIDGGYTCQ